MWSFHACGMKTNIVLWKEGNLLSSLMGSSEQEEGEESQDDSSPIELD